MDAFSWRILLRDEGRYRITCARIPVPARVAAPACSFAEMGVP